MTRPFYVPIGARPLTFPIETEATIRRRMLNICNDHGRKVVDIIRELAQMLDSLAGGSNKEAQSHYDKMLKMMEEIDELKATLLTEVASVGSLLINREDFLRLIFQVTEIADDAEAVAFRLHGIMTKKWKVDNKQMKAIASLTGLVLEEMLRLREAMMSLNLNPDKAIQLAKSVEAVERKIDLEHRNLDMEILGSKSPIQSVLLLRDIVQHLERMADSGLDVVDLVRVIAVVG
jgi:uncharacterized protein Yka (UPF0111/DUF47 family)